MVADSASSSRRRTPRRPPHSATSSAAVTSSSPSSPPRTGFFLGMESFGSSPASRPPTPLMALDPARTQNLLYGAGARTATLRRATACSKRRSCDGQEFGGWIGWTVLLSALSSRRMGDVRARSAAYFSPRAMASSSAPWRRARAGPPGVPRQPEDPAGGGRGRGNGSLAAAFVKNGSSSSDHRPTCFRVVLNGVTGDRTALSPHAS